MGIEIRRASTWRSRVRTGYSLLEVTFAIALLGIVTGSVIMVSQRTQSAYDAGSEAEKLESRARRTMERICDRLQASSSGNTSPRPESPLNNWFVDYQVATGVVAQEIEWDAPERIVLEYEPGEANDGEDNDGDGLIDEGQVVWIEDFGGAGEQRHVLCREVREYLEGEEPDGDDRNGNGLIDERGLSFDHDGESVTVRLTLEAFDTGHAPFRRTIERTISFRNKEE